MRFSFRFRSRRSALILGYAVWAVVASAWMAKSDSIFPAKKASKTMRASSSNTAASLYADSRAHDVGDALTIVISENTTATSTATTKTAHDDTVNAFGGSGLFQRIFKDFSLTATNSRAGNGTGSTTRSGTLSTTLSVIVKEVMPNGTLVVEGTRVVGINRETQKVTFTGIVRPEDIGYDNSVSSNLVANVIVHYDGKGIVSDTQRPGIISRVFRFLFQ